MFTKLQTKITIIIVLVLLVTLGTNNIIGSRIFNDEYEKALKNEVLVLGRNLKHQADMVMSYGIVMEDMMGFEVQCLNLKREYSEVVSFACVIDTEGKILFHDDVDKIGRNLDKNGDGKERAVIDSINNGDKEVFVKYEDEDGKMILAFILPIDNNHTTQTYGNDNEKAETANVGAVVLGVAYDVITDKISHYNKNLIVVSLLFIFISVVSILILISLWITKPIEKLIAMMIEVGNGNFTITADTKLKDEIGQAFTSFNKMISNIHSLISNVSSSSTKVGSFVGNVSDTSKNFYSISEQISLTVQEVAKGASEQSNEISQIMAYMNALSNGINKVNEDIKMVSSIVYDSLLLGNNAMETVKSLNDKASETTFASEKILGDINSLKENMVQIKNITNVISGITTQTNLLAFNAAIEAARAGESGKGFIVVASEIKKLASRSKDAAENINGIVNDIFEETESTVQAAQKTKIAMEEQMKVVVDTNIVFKTIFTKMENITEQVEHVSYSINSISELKLKTLQRVESILRVSEQSVAITEEVFSSTETQISSAEKLSELASKLDYMVKELNKLVSIFKV